MRSLGKKALWSVALISTALFGGVSASVDDNRVTMGETVTYTLKVSGQQVEKPVIGELCGQKVLSTSQGTSMQMSGGTFTKEYVFAYTFAPLKDCRIEPLTLKVDGKEERTEAIDIRVVPMQITKDSPFILEMQSEKKQVRVGEPFKVVIAFKQRRGSEAVDSKFEPPQIKNFWLKEQVQSRRFEEGDYTVTRITYVLAAQKSGKLSIDPAQIRIATRSASRDAWGQWLPQLKWRSYFSNALEVEALALPEGVTLVGDFTISAEADKHEIDANEAVNVTLKISGSGNFEDIGSLKPHVPDAAVYEEKPEISDYLEQGSYKGVWSQKLAFVSDRGFTVPPVTLRYFDPKTQSVKTVRSEPIPVRVRNAAVQKQESLKIERPKHEAGSEEGSPPLFAGMWQVPFAAGMLAGLMIAGGVWLVPWRRLSGRESNGRVNLKDRKSVLKQLLPYRSDPEVAELVARLESTLYGGSEEAIDDKRLKSILKRVQQSEYRVR